MYNRKSQRLRIVQICNYREIKKEITNVKKMKKCKFICRGFAQLKTVKLCKREKKREISKITQKTMLDF